MVYVLKLPINKLSAYGASRSKLLAIAPSAHFDTLTGITKTKTEIQVFHGTNPRLFASVVSTRDEENYEGMGVNRIHYRFATC
jgi:hypothetical protein